MLLPVRHPRWSQVDDYSVLRPNEAGIDECPFDAMGTLLDGGFRQADEHGFGQGAVGNIDLHLDGQGLDTQERKRAQAR